MNHQDERSRFRQRVLDGDKLLGAFCPAPSPELIEVAAYSGFDFVVIDAEHGPITISDVVHMTRAAHSAGAPVIVRVPEYSGEFIMRSLDAGVDGILVPQVEEAAEVQRIFQAMHYPPVGVRGLAFYARAHGFTRRTGPEAMNSANQHVLTSVLVETPKGVENIDEIMAVQGLDMVLVGTGDLAANIGYGPETAAKVDAAVTRVAEAGKRHGVTTAIAGQSADDAAKFARRGYKVMVTGMLPHLLRFCTDFVNASRKGMEAD
ncbi:HpcH/HpaI aldolase family protein [Paracoccus thiocyanatus]|nr:aldolase/citrate lyase family protein [Paracoccus thiocyanatus]